MYDADSMSVRGLTYHIYRSIFVLILASASFSLASLTESHVHFDILIVHIVKGGFVDIIIPFRLFIIFFLVILLFRVSLGNHFLLSLPFSFSASCLQHRVGADLETYIVIPTP